jgi:hypothetical protein
MADQITITLSTEKTDELWQSFYDLRNVHLDNFGDYLRETINDIDIIGYEWDHYADRLIIHFKTEQDKTWFALKWI